MEKGGILFEAEPCLTFAIAQSPLAGAGNLQDLFGNRRVRFLFARVTET